MGIREKIPGSKHNDRKCCVEGFFFLSFFSFPNQAAIQVSGEALTLAYTSKSFQRHLQLHSCFTGTLQALRTAASSNASRKSHSRCGFACTRPQRHPASASSDAKRAEKKTTQNVAQVAAGNNWCCRQDCTNQDQDIIRTRQGLLLSKTKSQQ